MVLPLTFTLNTLTFDRFENHGFDFGMYAELLPIGKRDSKSVGEGLEVLLVWNDETDDVRLQSASTDAHVVDQGTEFDDNLYSAKSNVLTTLQLH